MQSSVEVCIYLSAMIFASFSPLYVAKCLNLLGLKAERLHVLITQFSSLLAEVSVFPTLPVAELTKLGDSVLSHLSSSFTK